MKQEPTEQAQVMLSAMENRMATPQQLLERTDLTHAQKVGILRQWELDLLERMVADDENMTTAEPAPYDLDMVLEALQALGEAPASHPVPTTHG